MTLEELWALFPIVLTEHRDCWKEYFSEEAEALKAVLPSGAVISHIGSTAIKDIYAKPIVDILVEVGGDLRAISEIIQNAGYIKTSENATRVSFNKGYTENGFAEKVYHLHLRLFGDNDEIYFRDYLNAHPKVAAEYETLKLFLCKKFEHDRDGYTLAKTEFVQKYTAIAKSNYN